MDAMEAQEIGKAVREVAERWHLSGDHSKGKEREIGEALVKELSFRGLKIVRDSD